MAFKADTSGIKYLFFWIRPGLTRINASAVLFASFLTISLTVFMSLIQPYVMNEIVIIEKARQGTVTGILTLLQELVTILLVGFMGAWSDRVGRRRVYVLGFGVLGLAYFLYPFSSSIPDMVLYRSIFAIGIAMTPVMLSATVQDTPQEVSRARWIGFNNVLQGLGVLLIATVLLGNAPNWFVARGYDPISAGRFAFWIAAGLCVVAALVLRAGLPEGARHDAQKQSLWARFSDGVIEGIRNPRLAVAYGSAFIGRGDLVIVGNFLTLWVTQHGMATGLSTAAAAARGFMYFGIVQLSALCFAFLMGMIADRLNRVSGICVALGLATAGYSLMGQVDDPFGPFMIPVCILLGMGEVAVIVSGGALLGQEASARQRGAIIGVFNLMGAIGIMVAGTAGGIVFDKIGSTAPFAMMGVLNGVLLLPALYVRMRAGEPAPAAATQSG